MVDMFASISNIGIAPIIGLAIVVLLFVKAFQPKGSGGSSRGSNNNNNNNNNGGQ